jgi:hypothetical protein
MAWLKYVACLAFGIWAAPLLRPVEKLSLDEIATWGGQGPLADSGAPFMGVYHLHGKRQTCPSMSLDSIVSPSCCARAGMSGVLVADTTHCVSWDPTTRVLTCSFHSKAAVFPDGRVSDADFALDTSPTPRASGLVLARAVSLLRYSVAFHFNEALTKAVVIAHPSLLSCASDPCSLCLELRHAKRGACCDARLCMRV